jgi:hypothetical protein
MQSCVFEDFRCNTKNDRIDEQAIPKLKRYRRGVLQS